MTMNIFIGSTLTKFDAPINRFGLQGALTEHHRRGVLRRLRPQLMWERMGSKP